MDLLRISKKIKQNCLGWFLLFDDLPAKTVLVIENRLANSIQLRVFKVCVILGLKDARKLHYMLRSKKVL